MFYKIKKPLILLLLVMLILTSSWLFSSNNPSVSDWQVVNNNRTMETTTGYLLPYLNDIRSVQNSKDYYYMDSLYNRAVIDLAVKRGIDRTNLEKAIQVAHNKYPVLAEQIVLIETVNYKNRNAFVITYLNSHGCDGPPVIIIDRKSYKILFVASCM